jgi:hypothetical protein
MPPDQCAASPNRRRPAGQADGSGNLPATLAAGRVFPTAVAEFSRRSRRLLRPVAVLFCFLVVGCAQPETTPQRGSSIMMLDNRGGFSHGGRRIALRADGSYTDTTYSDVVGDEHRKTGHYLLNPERTHLVLSPEGGSSQELFRVDYGGQQYWVREADRARITQPRESWLRQTSVRGVP